jgi:hypothetical protein
MAGKRILSLDSNPEIVEPLGELLQHEGYESLVTTMKVGRWQSFALYQSIFLFKI